MMNIRRLAVLVATASMLLPVAAPAADHRDSPLATADVTADINDVYTFMNPRNASELIVATTVVPFASFGTRFSDAVEYRTHIDNGSAGGAQTITCRFANQSTTFSCTGPGGLAAAGNVGTTVQGTGMRVYAGLRDDPFFFDLDAFNRTRTTLTPSFTNPGVNFFRTANTLAIVMGIDRARVTANQANPVVKVYGSTKRVGDIGIDGGISGSWIETGKGGHGILVEVLAPETAGGPNRVFVEWFVYNRFGAQRWLFGTGTVNGNTVSIPASVTRGGTFPPLFDPAAVVIEPFGTLTLTFSSCNAGTLAFTTTSDEFFSGQIPISRLTSIRNLPCSLLASGQIDRMGRPGINTVLIDVIASTGKKDQYNRAEDPATWAGLFTAEMVSNLTALDTLDGTPGNALLPPAPFAGVVVDDRLIVDTRIATCNQYLAVELGVAGQCGGRTLERDVIDDSLGAIVGPGVSDFVGNDNTLLTDFPFLGEPR